ncbi:MAG TPA: hypothetical protein VFM52_03500 [Rhodanobacter sp.]|nr:hypothetical protein [Rhodanobacter sp.]
MPRLLATTVTLALLTATGAAMAANDSMSLTHFTPHVEPVLVQVDAQGKVTSASPAYALPPKIDRLLRANLAEMIRKPATDKHGKPIASQFVMNLALEAVPNDAGTYDTSFHYVSAQPVPAGSWFWSLEDGHRLALVNRNDRYRGLPRLHRGFPPVRRAPETGRNWQPAAQPAMQPMPRPASPPSPAR